MYLLLISARAAIISIVVYLVFILKQKKGGKKNPKIQIQLGCNDDDRRIRNCFGMLAPSIATPRAWQVHCPLSTNNFVMNLNKMGPYQT